MNWISLSSSFYNASLSSCNQNMKNDIFCTCWVPLSSSSWTQVLLCPLPVAVMGHVWQFLLKSFNSEVYVVMCSWTGDKPLTWFLENQCHWLLCSPHFAAEIDLFCGKCILEFLSLSIWEAFHLQWGLFIVGCNKRASYATLHCLQLIVIFSLNTVKNIYSGMNSQAIICIVLKFSPSAIMNIFLCHCIYNSLSNLTVSSVTTGYAFGFLEQDDGNSSTLHLSL